MFANRGLCVDTELGNTSDVAVDTVYVGVGGRIAPPRAENFLRGARLACPRLVSVRVSVSVSVCPGGPPILQLFSQKSTCFCTLFFAFFPDLDASGRVSDAHNHGSMDSSIMDLSIGCLISPLAIGSSALWRF